MCTVYVFCDLCTLLSMLITVSYTVASRKYRDNKKINIKEV